MEKYLPIFDYRSTEHTYIVKSEFDKTVSDLKENGKAIFKKHDFKTGNILQKEIQSDRYIKQFLQVEENAWGSFDDLKECSEIADGELESLRNGDFD
ncbi:hypothetical protein AVENLUH5627_02710 [Acinetobacter venetianus]|uniref:Uncharacterized protein n=1 Tax=Acinetobacter venetianus TaxID=52133 RepID=A0A150HLF3_9GAMM|nr:hypothetical protein [Acinetobacter venetianus]KXZ65980.1 hypothetical protein AVENLUH5627_02710 [Acinetobacter venetianus]